MCKIQQAEFDMKTEMFIVMITTLTVGVLWPVFETYISCISYILSGNC